MLKLIRNIVGMAGAAACAAMMSVSAASGQNVGRELDEFWDGVNVNVTSPRAGMGQAGGYFTGGSLVMRAPQRNIQPLSMTGPSIRAGCGGIDIYTGGFSFIDSDQLVAMMQALGANATGVAFQLALATVCPMCSDVISEMNNLAQEINSQNFNSCQAAQQLMGSVWPRHESGSRAVCQMAGSSSGIFSDFVSARHGCGLGGQTGNVLNHPEAEGRTFTNVNLAWAALTELPWMQGTSQDNQTAEFLMSMTGTAVITMGTGSNAQPEYHWFPPAGDTDRALTALMQGGEFDYYRCADGHESCLVVQTQQVTIPESQSLRARVRNVVDSMAEKLVTRAPLTTQELAFLNTTSIPIYRMLSVQHAHEVQAGNFGIVEVDERLIDLIAVDMVHMFIDAALAETQRSRSRMELASGENEYREWRDQVRQVRQFIHQKRIELAGETARDEAFIDHYVRMDQILSNRLQTRFMRQAMATRGGW